ncbi:hypothetical protein [Desulfomicrobium baculatum]|uniref:WD40 domain protein beta Propeller n=1 Tax=Desulfomicrobium baculatum (strain DSM 4028 / VKM B-1378 / X) TaxID=525897 RepID=C7LVJ7_DESBD|nr:hypothetical protein [Desulfomicrobium baculatum]ACU89753.1 hypothetical protein Dbac_1661 [Desulfomicrobium baculatum DSM 4028]
MRRILMTQALAASVCLMLVVVCCGPGFASTVEIATGPDGLLQMEQQGKVTVRALRGWGRLPDEYVKLAQRMRQESGLDLLGANLDQVRQWSADPALAQFGAELAKLAAFMEGGEHLDWSPPAPGASVPAGTLVRSGATRWAQAEDGPVEVPSAVQAEPAPTETVATEPVQAEPAQAEPVLVDPVQAEPVQAEPVQEGGTNTTSSLPPAAPSDAGPGDGVEFPLNDQVPGTYRVKLQVEGLSVAAPQDDPYFQRRLQHMLPEDPAVLAGEKGYFNKLSEYLNVKPVLDDDASYNLVLGFATPDTPVVIRVDAPDNPEIPLSEKEIADRISYRVAGKSVYVYEHDEARGDADIGFDDKLDGEVRWTPRIDPATGRPVGPRVLGIYMSYRIKKYIGDNELGILSTSQHRIGWVVVAMPGDVYEHEGALYAVGQEESLSAGGTAGPAPAPEKFDFQVSQYALDETAIGLSEDLRHVAWVEGEKEGKKRVVVNGVPGKWYDDVKGYALRFTPGGEMFRYEAELGEKEIPVFNGADGPIFDDLEFVDMSASGEHVLAGGKTGSVYRVYLDGKQVRETNASVRDGAVAENGKAAWIERGQDPQTGAEFAMVVTADGSEGQKYPAIHGSPRFTQNRAELYYIAEKEGGDRFLVRDGEELKPTMGSGYKFSVTPDSAFYAYVAQVDESVRSMVINGQIGPDFSDIWDPATFSADGQRHIYSAKKEKESFLVVDGQIVSHGFGALKSVVDETFSPDGSRWAAGFQLSDEEYVVVVDGKEIGRGQGSPRGIVFSPDGTRVAWLEKQKTSARICLDGQAGPEARDIYDEEPPQFSPDGRHLVYFTRDRKEKKMHIVVFGGEERAHDIIPPRAVFVEGGLEYLAIDGTHFRRESIPLD